MDGEAEVHEAHRGHPQDQPAAPGGRNEDAPGVKDFFGNADKLLLVNLGYGTTDFVPHKGEIANDV